MCPAKTAQYGLEIIFNPFVIGCTLSLENIYHQHDRDVPIQRTIIKSRSQAKSNDNLGTGHQNSRGNTILKVIQVRRCPRRLEVITNE